MRRNSTATAPTLRLLGRGFWRPQRRPLPRIGWLDQLVIVPVDHLFAGPALARYLPVILTI